MILIRILSRPIFHAKEIQQSFIADFIADALREVKIMSLFYFANHAEDAT